MPDTEWQARVKGMLKAELKRRNVTYKDLSARLEAMGVHETAPNLNNKISRGGWDDVLPAIGYGATWPIQVVVMAGP